LTPGPRKPFIRPKLREDPDLRIQVSSKLKGRDPVIESLHGTKAVLKSSAVQPSPAAIDFHRNEVFTK
jgi:hypothetical protein